MAYCAPRILPSLTAVCGSTCAALDHALFLHDLVDLGAIDEADLGARREVGDEQILDARGHAVEIGAAGSHRVIAKREHDHDGSVVGLRLHDHGQCERGGGGKQSGGVRQRTQHGLLLRHYSQTMHNSVTTVCTTPAYYTRQHVIPSAAAVTSSVPPRSTTNSLHMATH